ncbi:MAG: cupredoxin domain-containing protein [Nitrososphaerales archaeon]|nr:cupredoxin domain-containing protein [Nitrososphaerales archaeon]
MNSNKPLFALVAGSVILLAALLGYYQFVHQPMVPPPHETVGLPSGVKAIQITIVPYATASANHSFMPDSVTLTIGVNNSIVFYNNDSVGNGVPHEVAERGGAFHTGVLGYGESSALVVFTNQGTYNYYCEYHPTMVGKVTVT